MKGTTDPEKRILLDRLPRLLNGYGKTFSAYPGGSLELKKCGWHSVGKIKSEWAEKITPFMDIKKINLIVFAILGIL